MRLLARSSSALVWVVAALSVLALSPTASAVDGLVRASGFSEGGHEPVQQAVAYCPNGKVAIGAGAYINDHGRNRVRLTFLVPYEAGPRGAVLAVAEAPDLDRSFGWKLAAYAVCADASAFDRYEIVYGKSQYDDHRSFKTAAAVCPPGTVAYGAGAKITPVYPGHVGLHLIRTSGPLDITRAAARDDGRLFGPWTLWSYGICANPLGGIHARGEIKPGPEATATCPFPYLVHGSGGGGGLTNGGPVWLNKIYPSADLRTVSVRMTGVLPSGTMTVQPTCAL